MCYHLDPQDCGPRVGITAAKVATDLRNPRQIGLEFDDSFDALERVVHTCHLNEDKDGIALETITVLLG
jgi:hypothetical protein